MDELDAKQTQSWKKFMLELGKIDLTLRDVLNLGRDDQQELLKELDSLDIGDRYRIKGILKDSSTAERIESADKIQPGKISFFDPLVLSKSNPFRMVNFGCDQQLVWRANNECNKYHVMEIIQQAKQRNQSVHINTGTHGTPSGATAATHPELGQGTFTEEDLLAVKGEKNVSVHIISSYSGPIYPEKANHVIDAWCFSIESAPPPAHSLPLGGTKSSKAPTEKKQKQEPAPKQPCSECLPPGSDPRALNDRGESMIWLAAKRGHHGCIEPLAKLGANVSTPNKYGVTPVWIAACYGRKECIEVLAQLGANVSTRAKDGETPVFIAAENGHKECIEVLAQLGANVSTPDKWGRTPVWFAAFNGDKECIEVLAQLGANVSTPHIDGITPLDIAAERRHKECVELLKSLGAKE